MEKKTKIGIAILAVVTIVIIASAMSNTGDSFSREGKKVDASAEDLLPDTGSFPDSGWSVSSTEETDLDPNVVSAVNAVYLHMGYFSPETVTITIYVYDTPDNAKSIYESEKESVYLFGPSDYNKFEQSYKYSMGGFSSFYVFQDMNVYGEVYTTKILTDSEWSKIFSNIEGKIRNNAIDIV